MLGLIFGCFVFFLFIKRRVSLGIQCFKHMFLYVGFVVVVTGFCICLIGVMFLFKVGGCGGFHVGFVL